MSAAPHYHDITTHHHPMRSQHISPHLEVGQSFNNCAKVANCSAEVATESSEENKVALSS